MGKFRGVLILVGVIVLVVLIAGGAVMIFAGSNAEQKKSQDLARYGDAIVAKVCKEWDVDAYTAVAAPSAAKFSRGAGPGSMEVFRSFYGTFISGSGKIESFATGEDVEGVKTPRAFYVCDAVFTKVNATVRMELDKHGDLPWQVEEFRIEPR